MLDKENGNKVIMNTPEDINEYRGEFIVFFPDDNDPKVLYHGLIAEDAYQHAEEIEKENSKKPTVIRVQENETSSLVQVLAVNKI